MGLRQYGDSAPQSAVVLPFSVEPTEDGQPQLGPPVVPLKVSFFWVGRVPLLN